MVEIRSGASPLEYPTTIYINDVEHLTFQATPLHLDDFAIGLLFTEGLIAGLADVTGLVVEAERGLVWVDLRRDVVAPGEGAALAPASERGVVPPGAADLPPVPPGVQITPAVLATLVGDMVRHATLYHETRGIHSAIVARPATGQWLVREDIGRHNAVDKVIGAALRRGWPGPELVVCTTGRISYEMCAKLARFGCGLAASRTAATDMACDLADRLGMDLVGYVRTASRYRLYTAGHRLLQP